MHCSLKVAKLQMKIQSKRLREGGKERAVRERNIEKERAGERGRELEKEVEQLASRDRKRKKNL